MVDFTRVLAGPHCTKALRDLGADVTKIEPPSGDLGRVGLPHVDDIGLYYVQQNAGKRNLSLDLNLPEAREIVTRLCREADVIVENFRPGTLARFGFGYEDVSAFNPGDHLCVLERLRTIDVVAQSSGLRADRAGRDRLDRDRPGSFRRGACPSRATTRAAMQTSIPDCKASSPCSPPCSIAIGPARANTSTSRWPPRCCRSTSAPARMLSEIDTDGEPIALSANESHIFEMPDGPRLTIAGSPIYSPMFTRYCAMMRRNDLLADPRFATARLRRENLPSLLAEVRAWLATFDNLEQLQAQVSEAGLAVGRVRTVSEFAKSDWVKEWNAVVDVDDRAGGVVRMPGNPWIFSRSELPPPACPRTRANTTRRS